MSEAPTLFLYPMQIWALPYLYVWESFLFCIWWGSLAYVTSRFILIPLWNKLTGQ